MNELLNAAKAVIDWFDEVTPSDMPIEELRAAVELAEKRKDLGFDDWWDANADSKMGEVAIHKWDECWTAAQQAERERILDIIHDNRDVFSEGGFCLIVEKIDATTE